MRICPDPEAVSSISDPPLLIERRRNLVQAHLAFTGMRDGTLIGLFNVKLKKSFELNHGSLEINSLYMHIMQGPIYFFTTLN